MADSEQNQPPEKSKPKKKRLALKVVLVLLVAVIGLSAALWFVINSTREERETLRKYSQNIETLEKEKARCSALLGQERGEFSEYEYCRQLLQKFP